MQGVRLPWRVDVTATYEPHTFSSRLRTPRTRLLNSSSQVKHCEQACSKVPVTTSPNHRRRRHSNVLTLMILMPWMISAIICLIYRSVRIDTVGRWVVAHPLHAP